MEGAMKGESGGAMEGECGVWGWWKVRVGVRWRVSVECGGGGR